MRESLRMAALAALCVLAAFSADVSYDESFVSSARDAGYMPALFDYPYGTGLGTGFDSTRYTVNPFDQERPASLHVYIKGDKMARVGASSSLIYDLSTGTITRVNKEKRQYTVLTFAQMQKQMDKGPRCEQNCTLHLEETGQTAKINGVVANEYSISAVMGKGGSEFLAHASYWTVPTLPSSELAAFVKRCRERFAPRFVEVCALTQGAGFGPVAAVAGLEGYVVARVIETRSRAAGHALPSGEPHEPWNVNTGPSPAQIRRTETGISNVVEGPVDESVFVIPLGYRETKGKQF